MPLPSMTFWSQLIGHRGIKTSIETEFQGELKRWGAVYKVSQIPLRKDLNLSEGFKEFIKKKIRQTPSLWKVERVALFKPKQQDIEELAVTTVPETPQAITMINEDITPSESKPLSGAKRKVSVMKDPSSLSKSGQRRLKNVVSGIIQEGLNYTPKQIFPLDG